MKRHKLYTNYISYCARKKEEEKKQSSLFVANASKEIFQLYRNKVNLIITAPNYKPKTKRRKKLFR